MDQHPNDAFCHSYSDRWGLYLALCYHYYLSKNIVILGVFYVFNQLLAAAMYSNWKSLNII